VGKKRVDDAEFVRAVMHLSFLENGGMGGGSIVEKMVAPQK
jgi:hypothetical protein